MSQEITLEKETTKIERYLKERGREDFVEEVRNAPKEELNTRLLDLAKHREAISNTKQNDVALNTAKASKSTLEAPYNDQKRMNDKLTRFISLIMREQGMLD